MSAGDEEALVSQELGDLAEGEKPFGGVVDVVEGVGL